MQLTDLEKAIGYTFNNPDLLKLALSHTSYANEQRLGHLGSNERLEFLGDSVLELVSSEFFFNRFPEKEEGELTKLRASFVCERALADCAGKIPLSRYLLLGKGEDATGGRRRPSIISDAFEAVIGALYLDGGLGIAKEYIYKYVLSEVEHSVFFYDSKTILQEELHKIGGGEPDYILVKEEGPDHQKEFTYEVVMSGKVLGRGTDTSKKHAEQKAAYEALKQLGKVKD